MAALSPGLSLPQRVTSRVSKEVTILQEGGESHPPSAVHHRSYTLEFKLSVVDWIQSNSKSIRAASKQFGVDRKLIRAWLDSKEMLSLAIATHGPQRRKIHSGRPPLSRDIDREVLDYLCQQRREGAVVRNRDLQKKALECAQRAGLEGFMAGPMWLQRWKKRFNIELHNGTNDVVVRESPPALLQQAEGLRGAALLSHVSAKDKVKLPPLRKIQKLEEHRTTPVLPEGPIEFDFAASEHNYCRPEPENLLQTREVMAGNGASDEQQFLQDLRVISPTFDPDRAPPLFDPGRASPLFDIVGEVSGLELPLGHEETVGGEESRRKGAPSPRKRVRHTPRSPTLVATFTGLDDPAGPGGLLASRLSQPVFPTGPEIVYVDMAPSLASPLYDS